MSLAIQRHDRKSTNAKLAAGADVNEVDDQGLTPLFYAVSNEDADVVKKLLDKNAKVNINPLGGGVTPLMWAAYGSNPTIVKLLIDKGANPNAIETDSTGYTPLIFAVSSGTPSAIIMRYLMDAGANPSLKDKSGQSPLDLAIKRHDKVLTNILIAYGAKQ